MTNLFEQQVKKDMDNWEAVRAVNQIIRQGRRDEFLDSLALDVRETLFKGYILEEHCECLKASHDVLEKYRENVY
jgi:hypothetical protein